MAQIMNVSSILWFSARNEASTLPNFITPRIVSCNKFRAVCSIREYRSKVAEIY